MRPRAAEMRFFALPLPENRVGSIPVNYAPVETIKSFMKKILPFIYAPAVILAGLVAVLNCGCGPKETTPSSAPKKSAAASAEKTSFDAVTSKLDPGGNLYFYLSTEQWLNNISAKVSGLQQVLDSIPDLKTDDRDKVNKAFELVTRLIKDSGVEDVSGVGMSSIAREKGMYHSKVLVHHYPGKGSGFLWTMFGKQSHPLTGLELAPTNTVMATFSDLDLAVLWSEIQRQVSESGLPEAQAGLQKLPASFEQMTQLKWDKVLASLEGEFGFMVTFDESKKIPIPLPTAQGLEIPEPGLLIVAKVKDDTIFDRVDQALKGNQMVTSTDKPGLKLRTMSLPLPLPIQLRPTIASSGGYLFIASTDALIQEALAVKGGQRPGLKSTAEFKRLAQDVPQAGNHFAFMSQRFGQIVMQVAQQASQLNPKASPAQQEWMQTLVRPDQATFFFNVSANTDEGWLCVGNGNQSPARVMLLPAVAVSGMLAAIAIPNFVKARETAQRNACLNNLRMIDAAKQQWALEKNKPATATPTAADLKPYLMNNPFPVCPNGGVYKINSVSSDPECSIPGHKLSLPPQSPLP